MPVGTLTALLAWALATNSGADIPVADRNHANTIAVEDGRPAAPDDSRTYDPADAEPAAPSAHPVAPPAKATGDEPASFQWRPAISQASFFTAIMHAHRFATEEGTRDAIHGPFLPNYFDSVKAL